MLKDFMIGDELELPYWMIVQSFRYCLGRGTYVVDEWVHWCKHSWHRIPESERDIIRRELQAAVTARTNLGHDIDAKLWDSLYEFIVAADCT